MCRWRWCPGGVRLQLVGAVLLLLQTAALCSQPGSCACQRQRCLSEQRLGALLCTCGWYASLCRCCCFSVLLLPIPAAVAAAPAQPGRCSPSTACMPSADRPGVPAGPLPRCLALVLASPLPGPHKD